MRAAFEWVMALVMALMVSVELYRRMERGQRQEATLDQSLQQHTEALPISDLTTSPPESEPQQARAQTRKAEGRLEKMAEAEGQREGERAGGGSKPQPKPEPEPSTQPLGGLRVNVPKDRVPPEKRFLTQFHNKPLWKEACDDWWEDRMFEPGKGRNARFPTLYSRMVNDMIYRRKLPFRATVVSSLYHDLGWGNRRRMAASGFLFSLLTCRLFLIDEDRDNFDQYFDSPLEEFPIAFSAAAPLIQKAYNFTVPMRLSAWVLHAGPERRQSSFLCFSPNVDMPAAIVAMRESAPFVHSLVSNPYLEERLSYMFPASVGRSKGYNTLVSAANVEALLNSYLMSRPKPSFLNTGLEYVATKGYMEDGPIVAIQGRAFRDDKMKVFPNFTRLTSCAEAAATCHLGWPTNPKGRIFFTTDHRGKLCSFPLPAGGKNPALRGAGGCNKKKQSFPILMDLLDWFALSCADVAVSTGTNYPQSAASFSRTCRYHLLFAREKNETRLNPTPLDQSKMLDEASDSLECARTSPCAHPLTESVPDNYTAPTSPTPACEKWSKDPGRQAVWFAETIVAKGDPGGCGSYPNPAETRDLDFTVALRTSEQMASEQKTCSQPQLTQRTMTIRCSKRSCPNVNPVATFRPTDGKAWAFYLNDRRKRIRQWTDNFPIEM